jgi:uncharacterized protein YegP (UPF0339 family)
VRLSDLEPLLTGTRLHPKGERFMAGRFRLRKYQAYSFVLEAGNYEPILTSESYTQKAGAENGIASVKANAPLDDRYERRTAKDGSPYFVLKASNGQIIGTSETYSSIGARETGIAAVKANAPTAPIVDET